MPRYFYQAKNFKGQEESGFLVASDERQLAKALREKGYFLIKARLEGEEKEKFKLGKLNIFRRLAGVSFQEKLFFTKNLEVMIRTGVPLPRAFEILASQARSKKFREVLREIAARIIKGESISAALGFFPSIFSSFPRDPESWGGDGEIGRFFEDFSFPDGKRIHFASQS